MKKISYILMLCFITLESYASDVGSLFWVNKLDPRLKVWWGDLIFTLNNIIWYLIWLLYFIAVALWIYWWFMILTSWWEEDKVKKWKNIVLYVIYWLIVIFLASQLINWVIDIMSNSDIVWWEETIGN